MKYIRLSLLFIALSFSTLSFGQADKFESDVKEFIQLSNESNWSGVTDMMHPSMFSSAFSKEQMAAMMNQMKAMGLTTNIALKSITKVHGLVKHDGQSYQKFDYDVVVKITMSDQLWAQKDFILNGLKGNFGGENVKIDEATKTISMDGVQTMIAIKDSSAEWKYLPFQGASDATAKAALPAEVFEQVKELSKVGCLLFGA